MNAQTLRAQGGDAQSSSTSFLTRLHVAKEAYRTGERICRRHHTWSRNPEQTQIKKIGRARQKFERRKIAFIERTGVGPNPRDPILFQQPNNLGPMPASVTKFNGKSKALRELLEKFSQNLSAILGVKEGGSWISTTWSFDSSGSIARRKAFSSAVQSRSRQTWVISRGSLQLKRKKQELVRPSAGPRSPPARCKKSNQFQRRENSARKIRAIRIRATLKDKNFHAIPGSSRRKRRFEFLLVGEVQIERKSS